MKKTTKTLFSLLLVLVMVLQFGAMAPVARADIDNSKTVALKLSVTESDLTAAESVTDPEVISGWIDATKFPVAVSDIRENGLELSPKSGYAVIDLYIAPSEMEEPSTDLFDARHVSEEEGKAAVIVLDADAFADDAIFNDDDGNAEQYFLFVTLGKVSSSDGSVYVANGKSFTDPACTVPVDNSASTTDTFTVTFDANGHGTAPDAQKASKPTDPTAEGFTFGGWFTEAACENAYNFDNAVSADVTVYAKWTEDASQTQSFTVTFDANGHGTAPDAQTVKSGEKASKPTDPTAEGFTFGGWFTEAACTNAYNFDTAVSADVTVYAKWTEKAPSIIQDGTDTEWKPGSTSGLKIHIDAVYSDTLKDTLVVKVGDAVVPQDKYTVTNGSVTVTIDPSYLSTLPAGDHTVSITFPSGNTVSTTVTIPAAEPSVTALAFAIDEKGFTKVYDGKSFDLNTLKDYITLTNLPAGHKADIEITFETASVTEFHNVGTTTLKLHLKGVKDSADADVTSAFTCEDKTGVKLEITKRKIGVETRDDSKVYDGKAWSYTHMSNAQPIMTYPDAKLGEYVRDGKTYVQTISIKYTSSPKNMGTYENKAELIIREKEKGSSEAGTDVTANYEITYKFGKIKITDSKGNVPNSGVKTGDANNLWIWVGVMAAAVVLIVVLLFVMRKNKKNDAPTE